MNFDQAFDRTVGHEGAFGDLPHDRGNWTGGAEGRGELKGTKYGISAAAYPTLDIKNLTLDDAKTIYRIDYWGPAGCDAVPDAIKADLFDTAVNSGIRTAIKLVQRAVGEIEDGILGPRTLAALQSMPAPRLVARFNAHRLLMLTDIPSWPAFGKGWARRVANNLLEA